MCLRCPPGPILGAVPAFPVSAIPVLGQLEKEEEELEEEEKAKEEKEEEEYGRAGPGRRAGPTDSGLSCTSGQLRSSALSTHCLRTASSQPATLPLREPPPPPDHAWRHEPGERRLRSL